MNKLNEKDLPFMEAQSTPVPEAPDVAENDDEYFNEPYRPVEKERLPFREADFPVVIKQCIQTAPANRKVPIFISTLSPLGALATRVRLNYPYDIHPHAILLQTIIEAPPSTGKRCFAEVVRRIMESTLEARDLNQRRAEQAYREKKNARAQNQKIGEAPKTTIRCIPPATSKTVILKRADSNVRILGDMLSFWMFAEELQQLGDAGKSSYSNLRTVMRTAYDLDSKFGQDFASDNSYSGEADICICSMFCATPQDVNEIYNRREVMGGGSSRVLLVSLEDEIGAKPALFRAMNTEEEKIISAALAAIMNDTYTADGQLMPVIPLDTQWMNKAIDRFRDQCVKKVREMMAESLPGFTSLDHYRKRSSVNAFRAAGLMYYLYLLENRLAQANVPNAVPRSEEQIRKLCIKAFRFLASYCLKSNNNRWGKMYEAGTIKLKEGEATVHTFVPLFEKLTNEFDVAQVKKMIKESMLQSEPCVFISQWKKKGKIVKIGKGKYQKIQNKNV